MKRVFMNSKIPFRLHSKITDWIDRNRTPPYLSSVADVRHVDLQAEDGVNPKFLILCSDGLLDLSGFDWSKGMVRVAQEWVDIVALGLEQQEVNLALRLLRHALGGTDLGRVSSMMTVEMTESWMDDTTILVLPLDTLAEASA
jgi:pyruvate dehydrogenase phosphatase